MARWAPGRRFFNAYGPTETTIYSTLMACTGTYPHGPPIGRPVAWSGPARVTMYTCVELGGCAPTASGIWPEPGQVPMPDFWGGYLLEPDAVEFWQAGAFRLHDRLRYRRTDGGWAVDRLSP